MLWRMIHNKNKLNQMSFFELFLTCYIVTAFSTVIRFKSSTDTYILCTTDFLIKQNINFVYPNITTTDLQMGICFNKSFVDFVFVILNFNKSFLCISYEHKDKNICIIMYFGYCLWPLARYPVPDCALSGIKAARKFKPFLKSCRNRRKVFVAINTRTDIFH